MPISRPPVPCLLLAAGHGARAGITDPFDDFAPGWRNAWRDERRFGRATEFRETAVDGRTVLHARSARDQAALRRPLPGPAAARLEWEWKVGGLQPANRRERERAGDDCTARIVVVFARSLLPLRTRALCSVRSETVPAGTFFRSPYSDAVAMIVLRQGPAGRDTWQTESRDLLADYLRAFGRAPAGLAAVSVIMDTDDAGGTAEAWFAGLPLRTETEPPAAP